MDWVTSQGLMNTNATRIFVIKQPFLLLPKNLLLSDDSRGTKRRLIGSDSITDLSALPSPPPDTNRKQKCLFEERKRSLSLRTHFLRGARKSRFNFASLHPSPGDVTVKQFEMIDVENLNDNVNADYSRDLAHARCCVHVANRRKIGSS